MNEAVPVGSLSAILKAFELSRFTADLRFPRVYAGFTIEALLKAHTLPYLLPLKSERSLAFELAERLELHSAIGLHRGQLPSRATLWHFRRRNARLFRRLMLRGLALLAAEADSMAVNLPFVRSADEHIPLPISDAYTDTLTNTKIDIHMTPMATRTDATSWLPFPGMPDPSALAKAVRTLLHQAIDLPALVRWGRNDSMSTRLLIHPPWLDAPYSSVDLDEFFGRDDRTPYTACNVLVLRRTHDVDEILLTRRLRGSGAGTYAAPGGKKYPDESVLACVKRELFEEVGIEVRSGRPVSVRHTHRPGFPPVTSIGVATRDWQGTPHRRELLAHSEWEWYPLSHLPRPLFFPTEMAVDDFVANSFPRLDWDAIDPQRPLPLWENVE